MKKSLGLIFLMGALLSACNTGNKEAEETSVREETSVTTESTSDAETTTVFIPPTTETTTAPPPVDYMGRTVEEYFIGTQGSSTITKYDAAHNANVDISAVGNDVTVAFHFGDYRKIVNNTIYVREYASVSEEWFASDGIALMNEIEAKTGVRVPYIKDTQYYNSDGTLITHYYKDYFRGDSPYNKKPFPDLLSYTKDKRIGSRNVYISGVGTEDGGNGHYSFDRTLTVEGNTLVITNRCEDRLSLTNAKMLQLHFIKYPDAFLAGVDDIVDAIERTVEKKEYDIHIVYYTKADYTEADLLVHEGDYTPSQVKEIIAQYESTTQE